MKAPVAENIPAAAFSKALVAAAKDERVCLVINDSVETHYATEFQQIYPERVFDVGIAEQNMVGVAAGLANAGFLPFVYSASCFLTARAMEQIKCDVAYSHSNVTLCGFVSGLAYGALGGSHHALEDIAWMRAIPNLRVAAPASCAESAATIGACVRDPAPTFIRLVSKTSVAEMFDPCHDFRWGASDTLRGGNDVAIISCGLATTWARQAADLLAADGIEATVLHIGSISPLDENALRAVAERCRRVVVIEEHCIRGGLFGAVAETLAQYVATPVLPIGVPPAFAPIGPPEWLRSHFGLTPTAIAATVGQWCATSASTQSNGQRSVSA